MIAFGLVAAVLLAAALQVVRVPDLVHGVLWLGVVLVATALAYLQLSAGLLAAIQVMLYAGGVVTLMIFAVMLTARAGGGRPRVGYRRPVRAAVLAGSVLALLGWGLLASPLPESPGPAPTAEAIGRLLLQDHLLAFEALSVLLLAVMVGAIVVARRRDA